MLNMGRRDRLFDPKESDKNALKTPASPGLGGNMNPQSSPPTRPTNAPSAPLTRDAATAAAAAAPAIAPVGDHMTKPALPPTDPSATAIGPDTPGSRLCVGPKIKLKGVEISDCDVLVVEGEVEATVNSKAMQIAKPGMLKGHVAIDVAEIFGEFSGELTARTKLIVHSTGRVSGKIRYGKLVVAEGGELSGDVQRLDTNAEPTPARPLTPDAFSLLAPQTMS
jgi:cytoskeletal protein CcmA (bactofilin family)